MGNFYLQFNMLLFPSHFMVYPNLMHTVRLMAALNFLSTRNPQNAAILNTLKRVSREPLITITRTMGCPANPRVIRDQQGATFVAHKLNLMSLIWHTTLASLPGTGHVFH